ncbi:MAG TPA: hypothetical protein VM223_17445 [Planctomycetota bacterium]|nr:hypothetical protein [Planctomycetota bacterium]
MRRIVYVIIALAGGLAGGMLVQLLHRPAIAQEFASPQGQPTSDALTVREIRFIDAAGSLRAVLAVRDTIYPVQFIRGKSDKAPKASLCLLLAGKGKQQFVIAPIEGSGASLISAGDGLPELRIYGIKDNLFFSTRDAQLRLNEISGKVLP